MTMSTEPRIEARAAQPYVGISGLVTVATIGLIADRIPEIFGWLGKHGIEPAGAPFFRYYVIDMSAPMEIEVGVPVAAAAPDGLDGDLFAAVLPAGRYATVTHVGHPDGLMDVTAGLLDWAERRGLRWDVTQTAGGERWGCRLEVYRTDPAVEPDMNRWETDLAFRLAGDDDA
jgi:effector-binding domain-containing protein